MKIFIIDSLYGKFINNIYEDENDLAEKSYSEQYNYIINSLFGTSDFYIENLEKHGCECKKIFLNLESMQLKWLEEQYGKKGRFFKKIYDKFDSNRVVDKLRRELLFKILLKQVEEYQPEIIYILHPNLPRSLLRKLKSKSKFLCCQAGSLLPDTCVLNCYDLIITSY